MTDTNKLIDAEKLTRRMWLHYYNDQLFAREIITQDQWRKMRRRIDEEYRVKEA